MITLTNPFLQISGLVTSLLLSPSSLASSVFKRRQSTFYLFILIFLLSRLFRSLSLSLSTTLLQIIWWWWGGSVSIYYSSFSPCPLLRFNIELLFKTLQWIIHPACFLFNSFVSFVTILLNSSFSSILWTSMKRYPELPLAVYCQRSFLAFHSSPRECLISFVHLLSLLLTIVVCYFCCCLISLNYPDDVHWYGVNCFSVF